MAAKQILVLGGGFAGLWSAVGAARKLDELGLPPDAVEVTLVNRDPFHSIRVRNYEPDLSAIRVPLKDVLDPVGVRFVEADVTEINLDGQSVNVQTLSGIQTLQYDRLVFALGSQLARPAIPGLEQYSFDVDTFLGAERLSNHLASLTDSTEVPGQFTVVIVGAGLTGVETAAEMPDRLRTILARSNLTKPTRVILADHKPFVGSDMGESARPVISEAMTALGVETRLGVSVTSVSREGIQLETGEKIPAATVIWCAGMRANPFTRSFPVEHDPLGRVSVDEFMRIKGLVHVFAAGDAASANLDGQHVSVMSCQHGRPMGRFAGHNVVCDLRDIPMLPLRIEWYVTVLDLGPWGAVYTEGWDRRVVRKGQAARQTKKIINRQRIYPPLNGNRQDILAAAAPTVESPPKKSQTSEAQ